MVYTTIDKMREFMMEKNLPYFRVFDPGKNKIYDNDDVDAARTDKEIDKVVGFLEALEGTYVHVKLSKRAFVEKNKGGDTQTGAYEYRVNLHTGGRPKEGVGSTTNNFVNKQYAELLDKYQKLEMRVMIDENNRAWEKRFEELAAKNQESPLEKYAPVFLPVLQKIAGLPISNVNEAAQAQPINGTDTTPQNRNERIKNACMRLMKVDSNFIETIESLAAFAEAKPDAYKSYIPMLKTMI